MPKGTGDVSKRNDPYDCKQKIKSFRKVGTKVETEVWEGKGVKWRVRGVRTSFLET